MTLSDITVVIGVDSRHLRELRWSWPTWMAFKPELLQMPVVIFFDDSEVSPKDATFLGGHSNVRWVPWRMPCARNQREKMLCGFVQVPAREVDTRWYLKLDTDVVATDASPWIDLSWFNNLPEGRAPVIVAPPWGYSKPRYVMNLLDDWADSRAEFSGTSRLDLPYSSNSNKVIHPRIISWLMFGDTGWTRQMAAYAEADGRLPYPSQDTFLFYCAQRLGAPVRRVGMKHRGWAHLTLAKMKARVGELGLAPMLETHGATATF